MHRALKYSLIPILASGAILLMHISSRAQSQLSSPKGYVNDFAGVLDPKTRERLETTLNNLKKRSRIGFYIATVDSTGDKEIFDFSQWPRRPRSHNSVARCRAICPRVYWVT